jgi:hypothetical protein
MQYHHDVRNSMAIDEILQDLLSTGSEGTMGVDIDLSEGMMVMEETRGVATPDALVVALEKQVNLRFRDPGTGIHFVGLMLTLFAAEVVSTYVRRQGEMVQGQGTERVPSRMLSSLYSNEFVAFVLSPIEVCFLWTD